MGDPTILTWSIVPDGTLIVPNHTGESSDPSNLVATLNSVYGSRDSWLPIIESMFDRWSAVSGLSYVRVGDDGRAINPQNIASGSGDLRGDIRIGGHNVGTGTGLAGYAYFPDHGDIVLDTADPLLRITDNDSQRLRNLLAHEHGHSLGLEHLLSSDQSFLMESFISDFFDGPQFDEILLVQRAYGDALEERGGNDSLFDATPLGMIERGGRVELGKGAASAVIAPNETDFISIDGISDADYFTFEAPHQSQLNITLEPVGPVYQQSLVGATQTTLDATALNDLSLGLLSSGSFGAIVSSDSGGVGDAEHISYELTETGVYTLRIEGKLDRPQMYALTISVSDIHAAAGDVNGDGVVDVADIDVLASALRLGRQDSKYDVDQDGSVGPADYASLIEVSLNSYFGDANLDGEFASSDLVAVFVSGEYEDGVPMNSTWQEGDFTGDGDFDTSDLVAAFRSGGYESGPRNSAVAAVPEIQSMSGLILALWWLAVHRRSSLRRQHEPTRRVRGRR